MDILLVAATVFGRTLTFHECLRQRSFLIFKGKKAARWNLWMLFNGKHNCLSHLQTARADTTRKKISFTERSIFHRLSHLIIIFFPSWTPAALHNHLWRTWQSVVTTEGRKSTKSRCLLAHLKVWCPEFCVKPHSFWEVKLAKSIKVVFFPLLVLVQFDYQ